MRFSKGNVGNFKYSFLVSLTYVETGTLGLLGASIQALHENVVMSLVALVNLVTMPVFVLGFGLGVAEYQLLLPQAELQRLVLK